MNANMNPGARIPRNALRVWQSNQTIETLNGSELTGSLRTGIRLASPNAVHPKDWTDRCGFEALRRTAEELRRNEIAELSAQFKRVVGL